jgi:hypothetical protein
MKKLLSILAVIAISCFIQTASAQSVLDFKVVNKTGLTLYSLHVGESTSSEWGDDLLPEDLIEHGDEVEIKFKRGSETTCKWDFLVTKDADAKNSVAVMDINLCDVSVVTLTMEDGEIVYSTK